MKLLSTDWEYLSMWLQSEVRMKRYGERTWKPGKDKRVPAPNREQIQSAVEKYLQKGGKITKVEVLPESKEYRDWQAIHEFLNGD